MRRLLLHFLSSVSLKKTSLEMAWVCAITLFSWMVIKCPGILDKALGGWHPCPWPSSFRKALSATSDTLAAAGHPVAVVTAAVLVAGPPQGPSWPCWQAEEWRITLLCVLLVVVLSLLLRKVFMLEDLAMAAVPP
jgi:hypothetical protein